MAPFLVSKEVLEAVRRAVLTSDWKMSERTWIDLLRSKKETLALLADRETSIGPDGIILRISDSLRKTLH